MQDTAHIVSLFQVSKPSIRSGNNSTASGKQSEALQYHLQGAT
jgi:hypothetical protein